LALADVYDSFAVRVQFDCADFVVFRTANISSESTSTPDCHFVEKFEKMALEVLAFSPKEIEVSRLIINETKQFNGHVNYTNQTLNLNWNEKVPQLNQFTEIIFSHELGHLIFYEYLREAFPEILKAGLHFSPVQAPPENWSKLVDDVSRPYNETFADLVQALYWQSPSPNDRAFAISNLPPLDCRSFDRVLPEDFSSISMHCKIAKRRIQIWNQIVLPNLPDRRLVLDIVAKMFIEEIQMKMQESVPQAQ
jgi:hypothetical protein